METTELIWQEYREELLRFIKGRIRNKDIAEDLVHEVLIKVYSHRENLTDIKSLRAWLYRITRNTLIDYYRREKPSEMLPEQLFEEATTQSEITERELALCMKPLLKQLPEKYGRPLIMSDIEGVKQRTIAQEMGISVSGIKSRIQRGRAMLKDALLGCCEIELDHKGGIQQGDLQVFCDRCHSRESMLECESQP